MYMLYFTPPLPSRPIGTTISTTRGGEVGKIKAYHARNYLWFLLCEATRRILPLLNGMLVHHRFARSIPIYTPGWREVLWE